MSEEKKKGKKKGHGSHKNHVSLRLTVKDAIDKHMYPSAAFFASKLSLGDEDMYTSAMTNFMARQYGEAIKVILKRFKQPARYRYLRAKCHVIHLLLFLSIFVCLNKILVMCFTIYFSGGIGGMEPMSGAVYRYSFYSRWWAYLPSRC